MNETVKKIIVGCVFICLISDFVAILYTQKTIGWLADIASIHQTVLERQKQELEELRNYNNQLTKLWFEVTSIAITTHLKLNIIKNNMDKDALTEEN